jgi:signal transduction histidine kinase
MVISTMFALRSLKSRILAVLFFLLSFALLFDFFYLIPSIREGHVAAARRSQAELARQISSDLDFSFRQGIAEIEAIAQLPDIVSMKQARIDRALSELNTVTQFFNYYFVLDTAGSWVSYPSRPHMVGKRIPEKNMGWVRKTVAEDRTVFLDVVKSMVGTLVTGFSTPIRSEEGEVVGILRGVIVTTKTNALLSSLTPSRGGEPGYAYVVSSNGWLIAHPHIRQSADAFTVYDYGEYGPVAEVMQGNTGISEYEYEGEAWVAAYRPIPVTNWGVVVQQPKAAILESVGKATRLLVWLAGVLFFLSVILLMVGLQYSLRPLARLVGEIRSRTLPKDASFSDDEVGQIGREFHTLYSELSQSEAELKRLNQELEARVRERTRELQEANERLRHEMAERRRTEEQLLHAQKMEAVGRLTGGVAHEFNNILTSIMGFGEFLLDGLNRNEPLRRNAEMVVDSAERAAKLTEGLLAYSRKQVTQFELSDLNSIIRDMHEILAALAEPSRPGGPDADGAGAHEPRRQRPGRHAPGRKAVHRLGEAVHTRGAGFITLSDPSRHLCRPDRQGYRYRHEQGAAGDDIRALLHDEGRGEGHGAGALDCVWNRAEPPWFHRRAERGGERHLLQDLPPRERRRTGPAGEGTG